MSRTRESSKPSLAPATENGWHGNPAVSTSTGFTSSPTTENHRAVPGDSFPIGAAEELQNDLFEESITDFMLAEALSVSRDEAG